MSKSKRNPSRYLSVGNTQLKKFENAIKSTSEKISGIVPKQSKSLIDESDVRSKNVTKIIEEMSSVSRNRRKKRIRLVIDEDDRKPILTVAYPYNTICLLDVTTYYGASFQGTGFFISKRCIITAGHCVFNNGGWAEKVIVIPCAINKSEPYGRKVAKVFRSVQGWLDDNDGTVDYGAIILDDDSLFDKVQATLGYSIPDQESYIEIAGYPSDKGVDPYTCIGVIKNKSKYHLYYEVDTENGNSGSPIMAYNQKQWYAIGIHTNGNRQNSGLRLRSEMIARFKEWSKL